MELFQVIRYGKEFPERGEQLIKQILSNQEKAEKWDRLNSAFDTPIDWPNIEYFAVSEYNKENTHVAKFDIHTEKLEQENKELTEQMSIHAVSKLLEENKELKELLGDK